MEKILTNQLKPVGEVIRDNIPSDLDRIVTHDITWTEINGCLQIIKLDKDNINLGLPNVVIRVQGNDTEYDKEHITDQNGEIFIENLPRGTTYTITEQNNPNYGYTIMVSEEKKVTRGKAVIIRLNNEKQTGNLQIYKIDKDTREPLEGISFKIQSPTKGYVQAYIEQSSNEQAQLIGENRLTNLSYTDDISQATEFITDQNGLIGIYNILIDTYYVRETSVGKNSQYDLDDNYIDWSYESTVATNNTSGTGQISTVIVARQTSQSTDSVTNVHDTLTVENRKKYINLSGFVWEDLQYIVKDGSQKIDFNGIYDRNDPNNPDKLVGGIKVTLTDEEGNPVKLKEDTFGNPQANPKTTNAEGEYRFELVEIDKLKTYYIEFQYNGMSYTNVIPQTKDENNNEIPDTSKVAEGKNRTQFDENYETITYEQTSQKTQGISKKNDNKVYNINYDSTTNAHESKLIYKSDQNGKEDKTNYHYGYEGNENSDPFSGVDNQYYILANTKNVYNGYLNEIKSEEDIRTQGLKEIDNINLGLQKREKIDLTLIKDINSVKVSINNAEHIYQYADRFKPEVYEGWNLYKQDEQGNIMKDEEGNPIKIQNGHTISPQIKYGSNYGSMSYTRALYPSDIYYKKNDDEAEDKLKVEVIYKIEISNDTEKITTTINELTDYYHNRYHKMKVGTELNEDGTVKESIKGSTQTNMGEYTKVVIPANLEVKGRERGNSIYIQLEVKPEEIVSILGNDNHWIELSNSIEITSYSSKDQNENIYATIDRDSQPGNLVIDDKEKKTYEDDTDQAPGLKLVLQEEREVSGIVFVDGTGELKTGEHRQGSGQYDNEDTPVENVTVKLMKENGQIAKCYTSEGEEYDAQTTTNENGTYSIKGLIPDDYYIEFIWGGQTYQKGGKDELIRVQEYKSTVVNKDVHNVKSKDSNPEWYKDDFKQNYEGIEWNANETVSYYDQLGQIAIKKGAEIRTSDALDDYEVRTKIDKQTESMTNYNKKIIYDYNHVSSNLKNEQGEEITEKLIKTMNSQTPTFKVNIEYFKELNNSKEEYEIDKETGEVKMNGNYAVKKEEYQNHLQSIDFGIVERPKQVLQLEKEVKRVKITLANGNTLIDAEVRDNKIQGDVKHAVYIPESTTNAQIKCEIDNELIQGSNLEITYGLKITNISELDYKNKEFYYYGIGNGEKENDLIKLNPQQVIDYLDNNVSTVSSANDNLGTIKQSSDDKNQLIEDGLLENTEEMKKLLEKTNRVLIIEKLGKELVPKRDGKEEGAISQVELIASKQLTNTAVQDGIELDNSAEIIKVKKTGGAPLITIPGNYIANNSFELDGDRAETITIVPPTGLDNNDIAYIMLAISSLGILVSGICLIKRFVLK